MKKRVIFFLGVVGTLGLYSCQKNVREVSAVESSAIGTSNKQAPSTFFDPSGLISASQHGVLDELGTGYSFTEGPAVDKQGNIFFTDQPNDKIYRWDAATKQITTFLTGTGRSNGMAFDKEGNLIACADMHGELWKIAPDGSHTVLVDNYGGKLLNGPNDVWINPVTGGMYITDPIFPRGYWDNSDPRKINNPGWPPVYSQQAAMGKGGHVYYLAPGASTLIRVTTMVGWNADCWPNGVVGTPDGKTLYVNEWTGGFTGKMWSFDINTDGTLTNMKVHVSGLQGSDGMSMDDEGNIYVSGNGVLRAYTPVGGNKILEINTGGATNNVFGGKNNKTLFITTGAKLAAVDMTVKGVEKF